MASRNELLALIAEREMIEESSPSFFEGLDDDRRRLERRWSQGPDTVWLFRRPPRYWGARHRQTASEVARRLHLHPSDAARALQALFGPRSGWGEERAWCDRFGDYVTREVPLRRTDECGTWGPSIGSLLATVKRGGEHALAWIREGCPGYGGSHTGENPLWSHFFGATDPVCRVSGGLSRRQWGKWRLVCRLLERGLEKVPFTILRGIDKLQGRSKVVAFAVLKSMVEEVYPGEPRNCSAINAEEFWRKTADYIRGQRDVRELVAHMTRGDVWNVFHGRFAFSSSEMEVVRGAQLEKNLIAELSEGRRMRFFLRLLRQEGTRGGGHTVLAAARLAVWLGDKAEAFVKRSDLSLHDAGINLPTSGMTEEKSQFLFRYAHKAYTAASVVKNWEGILALMEWREDAGEPNPLLAKGGLEKAEAMLSAFTYEGTRHLEFARVAAECHVGQAEFSYLQDRWLSALERLTHQSVPAPAMQEGGDLRLAQLAKDDPRAVFAGVYTGCCQHPGGVGASCAEHAHDSPDGAIWAVERHGQIVAQAWVWRRGNALVLDSVEATASIGSETRERSKALFQRAADSVVGKLGVSRVYVGTCYGGVHWNELESNSRPFGSPASYSDSSLVWKIAGGAR